jgi:hypothetical protein
MRALFGVLVTIAIAITAGVVGFQAGVASNIAAAGGVVWLGGGFPGLGFLFFLLFIGFLFFAVGGARRHAMGHGGPWGAGHGAWGPGTDARREWVREMHRRLHEEEAGTPGTTAGSPAPGDRTPAA